jgi:hypothetical protein
MKERVILGGSADRAVLSIATTQQEIGDTANGVATANDVCSRRHAVQEEQLLSPNLGAPTFARIAAAPGMTAAALKWDAYDAA